MFEGLVDELALTVGPEWPTVVFRACGVGEAVGDDGMQFGSPFNLPASKKYAPGVPAVTSKVPAAVDIAVVSAAAGVAVVPAPGAPVAELSDELVLELEDDLVEATGGLCEVGEDEGGAADDPVETVTGGADCIVEVLALEVGCIETVDCVKPGALVEVDETMFEGLVDEPALAVGPEWPTVMVVACGVGEAVGDVGMQFGS
uniref:Uncharacterized protein n=1 Tax=Plectus sambesii TaxID=2011161 RepID=A0A914USM2_9BILA